MPDHERPTMPVPEKSAFGFYFVAMFTFALPLALIIGIGTAAWFVAGWLGAEDKTRFVVATQTPLAAALLLVLASIIARPPKP